MTDSPRFARSVDRASILSEEPTHRKERETTASPRCFQWVNPATDIRWFPCNPWRPVISSGRRSGRRPRLPVWRACRRAPQARRPVATAGQISQPTSNSGEPPLTAHNGALARRLDPPMTSAPAAGSSMRKVHEAVEGRRDNAVTSPACPRRRRRAPGGGFSRAGRRLRPGWTSIRSRVFCGRRRGRWRRAARPSA